MPEVSDEPHVHRAHHHLLMALKDGRLRWWPSGVPGMTACRAAGVNHSLGIARSINGIQELIYASLFTQLGNVLPQMIWNKHTKKTNMKWHVLPQIIWKKHPPHNEMTFTKLHMLYFNSYYLDMFILYNICRYYHSNVPPTWKLALKMRILYQGRKNSL